ncbi:MAG TPA: YegS/Rv2252/BmrU family lipid kinase [Microlunatus sp.]
MLTLVVNPSAGKGRAQAMLPQVAGTLRDAGVEVRILLSRDFAEARRLTTEAVLAGRGPLAVMGGDGMMHLGINTVMQCGAGLGSGRIPLGLIPAGTGNDLCRGLGLPPADPVAGAAVIAAGDVRTVDLMEVNGHYVGGVLATGFDALVNARANALPWPKGGLRYPLAVVAELSVFSPLRYRLSFDGEEREQYAMLVAIGNTSSYGGGMRICPDADPADGWLDITVVHRASRLKLLRLLPAMYSGRFVRDPCVEQLRAREVRVEGPGLVGYGDGELIAAAPLDVRVRAGALTVFAPL